MLGVYIEKWMFKTEREVERGINKKVSTDSRARGSCFGVSREKRFPCVDLISM